MMFASHELNAHPGTRRMGAPLSPFSPSSPINYSPHDHAPTPPSPVKMEPYYHGGPQSPLSLKMEPMKMENLKLEPMSPSGSYMRTSRGINGIDWQPSPSASSMDSMPPHSPMSGINFTASSPLSPSSTITMSPSTKQGREDLSPASSITSNGFEPPDKKPHKKSAGGRQTEELCLVCGDRASGYHYNALTCEGCKGFFRRSITKKSVYTCKYGKHCEMDMYMRRKCQECRFKKCINVGMRPECVVPESTCKTKRNQKKAREKDKTIIKQEIISLTTDFPHMATPTLPGLPAPLTLNPASYDKSNCKIDLTKEHQELINRLIINQDEYESPPDETVKSLIGTVVASDEVNFRQITEMTKLTVELIVKFALNAPGFVNIPVNDQVTLLKACTSELITLRASRRYHPNTDSIVFANNIPCTREYYTNAGMELETTDSLFNFCKNMADMKVDNAEYALLSGITLFSERPNLEDAKKVEIIQYLYVETLYAYVSNKWAPKSGTMVAKLLNVLTQLRSLGVMNNEQCETFVNNDKPLPDILKEIWDMDKKR